jgi:hypothetical protein
MQNGLTVSSVTNIGSVNILGSIIGSLPEFTDNDSATGGGVPLWGFYRTAGIIKIRINTVPTIISLNGASIINSNFGLTFTDPGVTLTDSVNYYVETIGTVSINKLGSYIRYYNAMDLNGNIINTISRIINII